MLTAYLLASAAIGLVVASVYIHEARRVTLGAILTGLVSAIVWPLACGFAALLWSLERKGRLKL